jgi:AAA+ ATPase superfamily predicted ATPase
MIGREKELEEIQEHIKHGQSVLILGRKGIGKTTLLRHIAEKMKGIYVEFPSAKAILEEIVSHLAIPLEKNTRYITTKELLDLVRQRKRKQVVLLIDEAESISKFCGRVLEKLQDEDFIIIGASEKKVWNFRFRNELELRPLSREQSKELAEEFLGDLATPLVLDLIATKSLGVPGKIKEICSDIKAYHKNLDILLIDKKSVFEFFRNVKPEFPERINIFPLWALFVVGFGALLVKVLLYSKGNFHDAYMVAAFGYMSLIVYRIVKSKQ